MKRLLLFALIILVSITALCFSPLGRYASRATQDGMIYFLMPTNLKDISGIKKFEYDVTLLSWTDSATVNFTIHADSKLIPEDIEIKTDNSSIKCNSYHPLFVDIYKKGYEIRVSSQFSIKEIEEIFKSQNPPVFMFRQGNDMKSATYSRRSWGKDQQQLLKIFDLYLYSK